MKYKAKFILPGNDEKTIGIDEDEYILDAAYREDIDLPSMCRQGYCLTCLCFVRGKSRSIRSSKNIFIGY